jgi:hypothetical protein
LFVLASFSHWDLPKSRDCEKGCVVMFKVAMQELLSISWLKSQQKSKIENLGELGMCSWYCWKALDEYENHLPMPFMNMGALRWFHKFQTHGVWVVIFLLVNFCQTLKNMISTYAKNFSCKNETNLTNFLFKNPKFQISAYMVCSQIWLF